MNTKILLAALVGGIAAFLLGYLVFGMLMMPMFTAHETSQYAGAMKDMTHPSASSFIAIFIANLSWSLALALIMSWSNMVGFMKGAVIGLVIGFLMQLSFDMFNLALMNMYTDSMIIVVDVIVNALFGAVIGGVIGWMMGMGKKAVTAPAM